MHLISQEFLYDSFNFIYGISFSLSDNIFDYREISLLPRYINYLIILNNLLAIKNRYRVENNFSR